MNHIDALERNKFVAYYNVTVAYSNDVVELEHNSLLEEHKIVQVHNKVVRVQVHSRTVRVQVHNRTVQVQVHNRTVRVQVHNIDEPVGNIDGEERVHNTIVWVHNKRIGCCCDIRKYQRLPCYMKTTGQQRAATSKYDSSRGSP